MGCFLGLLSRVGLLCAWLLTPLVNRAFHGGWVLPVLGIIFLPLTTLSYVVVYALEGGVHGWAWLWVVGAVLFDLGVGSNGALASRKRIIIYRTEHADKPASEM
jgi:hypothetical protein